MNRRNFIGNLILAGASFAILPGAGRLWKATRLPPGGYIELMMRLETAFELDSMLLPLDEWQFILHGKPMPHWT